MLKAFIWVREKFSIIVLVFRLSSNYLSLTSEPNALPVTPRVKNALNFKLINLPHVYFFRTVRWPMMMVVFRHCWLVFGTISIALYPPPPSLFVGKTCCVLIQQHFLYFFPFSALLALEPKKAAASGLHQSGFVSKR